MKTKTFLAILFIIHAIALSTTYSYSEKDKSITISGEVTDFEGNPVDSAMVEAKKADFSTAYKTFTDENGNYKLTMKKGKYLALLAIKMNEYPRFSDLPENKQRLQFWAWNFIAEKDTVIDIQYHRLEIYGLHVFQVYGAAPGYTIYCRPMTLSRFYDDHLSLTPNPDELDVKVEINGKAVKVNMLQKVEEYSPSGELYGYLIHVDFPKELSKKPYDVFRIEMTDKVTNDRGGALFFKEKADYR